MNNRLSPFVWRDTPRNAKRVIEILKIGPAEDRQVVICSPKVWGYATHWHPDLNRTVRCTKTLGGCEHCESHLPQRDKGLLLVANGVGELVGFLELTPSAWETVLGFSTTLGGLRGKVIRVYRTRKDKKGRLLVSPLGDYQGPRALPDDRSPEATLRRVHGLPDSD